MHRHVWHDSTSFVGEPTVHLLSKISSTHAQQLAHQQAIFKVHIVEAAAHRASKVQFAVKMESGLTGQARVLLSVCKMYADSCCTSSLDMRSAIQSNNLHMPFLGLPAKDVPSFTLGMHF